MTSTVEPIKVFHFLRDDGRLDHEARHRRVQAGKTYRLPKGQTPNICKRGFHGSIRAIDALKYANGSIVTRCLIYPPYEQENDKICGVAREVLAIADATNTLHEFACWNADQALKLLDQKDVDPRSVAAIDTKRRWLRGEATDEELAAAWDAAWAAARAAAWDAAWAAARAAAWDAAWAAARDAARNAAWAAARNAAWAAARAVQNVQLEAVLTELLEATA